MPKSFAGIALMVVVILAVVYLAFQIDFTRKLFNVAKEN